MRLERNIMQFDSNEGIQCFDLTVNFMLVKIKIFRYDDNFVGDVDSNVQLFNSSASLPQLEILAISMNETKTLSDHSHARKKIYFYIRILNKFHIPVCT